MREVTLHKEMSHPSIIRLYNSFQVGDTLYIILEFMDNGNIFKFIRERSMTVDVAIKVFSQVLSAVAYFHSKKIIHRDIKPENILWNRQGQFKLSDFGFCGDYMEGMGRKTMCGTTEYIAPEVVMNDRQDDKLDVWCMGILLYEMLHHKAPYQVKNTYWLMQEIKSKKVECDPNLPKELRDIINACLQVEPTKRPTAQQLIDTFPIIRENIARPTSVPSHPQPQLHSRPQSDLRFTKEPHEEKRTFKKQNAPAERDFTNSQQLPSTTPLASSNSIQTNFGHPSSSQKAPITIKAGGSFGTTTHFQGNGYTKYGTKDHIYSPAQKLTAPVQRDRVNIMLEGYTSAIDFKKNGVALNDSHGKLGKDQPEKRTVGSVKTDPLASRPEASEQKQTHGFFTHKKSTPMTEMIKTQPHFYAPQTTSYNQTQPTNLIYEEAKSLPLSKTTSLAAAKTDSTWQAHHRKNELKTVFVNDFHDKRYQPETALYPESPHPSIVHKMSELNQANPEFVNIYNKPAGHDLSKTAPAQKLTQNAAPMPRETHVVTTTNPWSDQTSFARMLQVSPHRPPGALPHRTSEGARLSVTTTNYHQFATPTKRLTSENNSEDKLKRYYSIEKFKAAQQMNPVSGVPTEGARVTLQVPDRAPTQVTSGSLSIPKKTPQPVRAGGSVVGASSETQGVTYRSISRGPKPSSNPSTDDSKRFEMNPFTARKI